jgi:hypothetical protein
LATADSPARPLACTRNNDSKSTSFLNQSYAVLFRISANPWLCWHAFAYTENLAEDGGRKTRKFNGRVFANCLYMKQQLASRSRCVDLLLIQVEIHTVGLQVLDCAKQIDQRSAQATERDIPMGLQFY